MTVRPIWVESFEDVTRELQLLADGLPDLAALRLEAERALTREAGVQYVRGAVSEVESASFAGGSPQTILPISFTPRVSCWWRVHGTTIVRCMDAAWNSCALSIVLSPSDAFSIAAGPITIAQGNSGVTPGIWGGLTPRALFKLQAGVAYTASLKIAPREGTWRYWDGATYLTMSSEVVGYW